MWEWLERFLFESRWYRDEYAWRVWQDIANYRAQVPPHLWHRGLISAQVTRTYERARGGTKALADFGPAVGVQDTWWPRMAPLRGRFVLVEAHLWPGPDTHSGGPVIWIDRWHSTAPNDVLKRTVRHEMRIAKLAAAEAKADA